MQPTPDLSTTRVAHVMTAEPVCVRPDDTVMRAAQLMDELNIGALPVCLEGELLGIVTDRDLAVRATAADLFPSLVKVHQVMSKGVRCCRAGDTTAEVLHEMARVQIRRMPVVDRQSNLVGIVTLGDLAARQVPGVDAALRLIGTPCIPDRAPQEGPATAGVPA